MIWRYNNMSLHCQQPQAASRLDKFVLYTGTAFPAALITGNSAFEAVIALVGLSWLIGLYIHRRNPLPDLLNHPLVLPWLAWYGIVVISLMINGPGNKGWAHDIVFFRQFLFMAALLDISRRLPVVKYLTIGLAIGVFWATSNLLTAYLAGYDFLGNSLAEHQSKIYLTGRMSGVAAYAGALFCCLGILGKYAMKIRILTLGIGVVSLFLVIHSQGRTVTIAAFLGIFTCLAYYFGKRFSKKTLVILGVSAILFAGLLAQNIKISNVINLSSLYQRFEIWQVTTKIWQESPVVGTGVSSFQDAYKEQAATSSTLIKEATHAHNIILMLLACTGVIGLGTFIWLFIQLAICSVKIPGQHSYFISLLTVFLVIGLTGFNIYHSWYMSLFAYIAALLGSFMAKNAGKFCYKI